MLLLLITSHYNGGLQPTVVRQNFTEVLTLLSQDKKTYRHTVDGRNPANQLIYVGYHPIIYQGFSTIPGGWPWDFRTINSMVHNYTQKINE